MTALRLHLGLVLLFLWAPLLGLALLSLNDAGSTTVWPGLSGRWYELLWQSEAVRQAAGNSAFVAVVSSLVATLLGTLLALGLRARPQSALLEAMLATPVLLPEVVLAVGLLSLFSLLQAALGLPAMALSHSVLSLAFATALVRRRLSACGPQLLEASTNLGAGRFTSFRRITLPLLLPGVLAAWLLAFALSLGEYVVASLTAEAAPDAATLPLLLWTQIDSGALPETNALATLLGLVAIILVPLALRLSRPPRAA
jgi:spermidine/putrescine transport system permease protein